MPDPADEPGGVGSLPASACAPGTEGSHGPDRVTRNVYDSERRLTQEQHAYGTPLQQNYASYGYSANGNHTSVTDANGNRAELRYDGHGRQVRWVFPHPTSIGAVNENDYESYGYDAAGNRTSRRKRDGSVFTFQYDALNRMTLKVVPERAGLAATHTRDVHYGYDVGNRQLFARFDSPTGEGVTNSYDSLGRPTGSTIAMDGVTRTLVHQLDVAGRRTRLTFPDNAWVMYTYDAAGRPQGMFDWAGGDLNRVNYHPSGLVHTRQLRNPRAVWFSSPVDFL